MNNDTLKAGYKRTELGVIPSDWEVEKLEDIADSSDSYSITGGPFGSDLKSEHYTKNGVRIVQLQNIGDGCFNDDYKVFTSNEKADELRNCNIYPNDIIIAKMAEPVARACKIPTEFDRYLMCSDGIRLLVDKYRMDTDYTVYAINSKYFRNNATANSTGTTRLRIGLSKLKSLHLVVPPLKEQRKIASILSSVDEHMEEVDCMIGDLKELKKGLMQKLLSGQYTIENEKLVKTKEFKKTRLGLVPKSWEVKKLDKLLNILSGYAFSSSNFNEEKRGIPLIRIRDLQNSNIATYYAGDYDSKYIIEKDDVLIGMDGDFYVSKWNNEKALLNQRVCKIEAIDSNVLDIMFIYYRIQSEIKYIHRITPATTVKHLSTQDIKNIKIPIPTINEQRKISKILLIMDERMEYYEKEKEDLNQLKKGLMQQLLTGKVRVKVN